jgi:hypothetical protein
VEVPPEWSDETGASVFDRPGTARRQPPPPPPGTPPRAPYAGDGGPDAPTRLDAGQDWGDPYAPTPRDGGWPDDSQRTLQHPQQYQGGGYAPGQGRVGHGYDQGYGAPPGYGRPGPGGGYGQPDRGYGDRGRSDPMRRPQRRPAPEPDRAGRDRRPRGGGLPFGFGTLVGVAGLVGVLLALTTLPWFTVGDQDVALPDIRSAFTIPETEAEDLRGEGDTPTTLPDGTLPTPEQLGDAAVDQVGDAASRAAAEAIDTGKARYLELYVDRLWSIVAIATALAVLFSTILAPRSFALGLLLGFRRLAGFVTVLGAGAHGVALWIVFSGDGAPSPAAGVWASVAGFAGVLLGCILGPKR